MYSTTVCETLKHRIGQLEENGNANEYWQLLKQTIHQSALDTFGVSSHRNPDWYVASLDTVKPAIEAKRKVLLEFKSRPNEITSARYSESRSLAQRTAGRALHLYYVGLSEDIETAAKTGNLKSMYAGIKTAIGPTIKKTAPLRSKDGVTLTRRADQMNRWIEHFSDLYDTERPYTAIDKVPSMEIMEELDDEPQFTEMEAVVARL